MATTRLVLSFTDSEGATTTLSYNNVNPELEQTAVQAIVSAMLTNGSIFEKVPTIAKSAKIVTTDETAFDLPSA